jgi:translation initiation factor IF-3
VREVARLNFDVFKERFTIALQKAHRVNEEINAPEIRLQGVEGEQLGVMSIRQALAAG